MQVGPFLLLLWTIYLSLAVTGGVFMGYQWDALLLEAGFLGALLAPWRLRLRRADEDVSRWAVFLHHWLIFRLMFFSGLVKLTSGDLTWRNGTALNYHYETQPIPNALAWYAHQLPDWLHWVNVQAMFGIELILPFFVFLGRVPRLLAFLGFAGLNGLIILTGNYTYFNYLTILLCVPLLEDAWWPRKMLGVLPGDAPFDPRKKAAPVILKQRHRGGTTLRLLAGGFVFYISLTVVFDQVARGRWSLPERLKRPAALAAPFRSVNGYGLFAVMTTTRPEIEIEGSRDGVEWKAYEFKWKPGELDGRPRVVAPHQPRLDWQMWFAALRGRHDPAQGGWFTRFLIALMGNSKPVLDLMKENPFPGEPPVYVRARLYRYHFTNFESRKQTGNWWKRELLGEYCPEISLRK